MKRIQLLIVGAGLALFFSCESNQHAILFDLVAEKQNYAKGPMVVTLPQAWHGTEAISVQNIEKGSLLPAQRLSDSTCAFLLDDFLPLGSKRRYLLRKSPENRQEEQVRFLETEGTIQAQIANRPVLTYHAATAYPPEGSPGYYAKSGFLHPIQTPKGVTVSDGFPKGHMHQHGMFFAWVNTTFQGQKVDFWNTQRETGTVIHDSLLLVNSGPVAGQFKSKLTHLAIQEGDSIPVLEETLEVRTYLMDDVHIIDIHSQQSCLTDSPLHLNEYHYGGMGIRMSGEWFPGEHAGEMTENRQGPGQGGFFTSEGLERFEGNHTRPHWVAGQGNIGGQEAGIVGMGHPENFRFPQPVRIHPSMPYFCFAPMVEGAFDISPGEVYESKYRFVVFDGPLDPDKINSWWHLYGTPPKVVWEQ